MIYLRTGLPGSGKTLRTIALAREAVLQGREVYALNVNGLDYEATGIKEWTKSLEDWRDLPKGAMLIVDEVQTWLRPRGAQSTVPDWIEALTRNRHYGIDLHFVTQDAMLIDAYVRRLVNYHEHLVRMDGGFDRARVYSSEAVMSITGNKVPAGAEFKLWSYPKEVFAVYKSAAAHTVRKRIPQSLKFAGIGLVLVVVCVFGAITVMRGLGTSSAQEPDQDKAAASIPARPAMPAAGFDLGTLGGGEKRPMTTAEYLTAIMPRVAGMPWSAPIYDTFQPTTPPQIFCMSSAKGCRCYTEQATRITVDDSLCRAIVQDGLYDPFLTARRDQARPHLTH